MTTPQSRLLIIKGAILVLLLALIFFLSRYVPQPLAVLEPLWHDLDGVEAFLTKREKVARFLHSFGAYSPAVFILAQAFQVVASPIPGELTGMVGGYVYGRAFGFLLSTLGLTLGSWLSFELARVLGRPLVERFVRSQLLHKFDFLTTNAGATVCFLLFLLPGFPKDYLCYVLGLSHMGLGTFLIVSTIGRMPGTYLLTFQGASIRSQDYWTALAFGVISAAILFLAYLHRERLFRWVKRKSLRPV